MNRTIFNFYDGQPYFTIQSSIRNKFKVPMKIMEFYPFYILPERGGKLLLGADLVNWTFYKKYD